MNTPCIYLDHHATTPMDTRVFDKIKPFFLSQFGNPASNSHPYGWQAQEAVKQARIEVAKAINAHPQEILFTSGATEATNMALKGLFLPTTSINKKKIVTSSIEHRATLSTIEALACLRIETEIIRPSSAGSITPDSVKRAMSDDVAVVSLFLVHNEIGSINPIADIASVVHESGALLHVDAAQAMGRVEIDCQKTSIDMMSFSGHKIYGPKGVGFLYVKRNIMPMLAPLISGGGQEQNKRSGTLNVPGIVGMGEAVRLCNLGLLQENNDIKILRDRLLDNLMALDGVHVNGSMENRVSGNLNVSFEGIDGEDLVLSICNRVAISTGSACSSNEHGQSQTLSEMGISPELRQASIRFGLGRTTTIKDVDIASQLIVDQVKRQRVENAKGGLTKIMRRK